MPIEADDQSLIERACRAANGTKFQALWAGDISGYGSHSEADLAFCSVAAFWTGRDAVPMDRWYRSSRLMRHKWNTRRGDSTYGVRTIDKAIARCQDTYAPHALEFGPALHAHEGTGKPPVVPDEGGISVNDFYAYMPMHNYMFVPSRELWPAASVNARLTAVPLLNADGTPSLDDDGAPKKSRASAWLDRHRAVEQMTWAPGLPLIVPDRLVSSGGWIERADCSTFNLYRPPTICRGDARQAGRWLEHLHRVYPADADHIIAWLAHLVQRPHEKINHARVLGGSQGIVRIRCSTRSNARSDHGISPRLAQGTSSAASTIS